MPEYSKEAGARINKNKIANILTKINIPRKFEIFVEEFDEEGGPHGTPAWKPVKNDPSLGGTGGNPVITISSQKEYQEKLGFYQSAGQRFRIIREIDPPTELDIIRAAKEQGVDVGDLDAEPKNESVSAPQRDPRPDTKPAPEAGNRAEQEHGAKSGHEQTGPGAKHACPKIVKIGDIEIKYDGDIVYQKQWVRLTDDECRNYRIVNTQNNRIVPLNGKHIEAKRWVAVQEQTEHEDLSND